MTVSGFCQGLAVQAAPVLQYALCLDEQHLSLNDCLGKVLCIQWTGRIRCQGCQSIIKKAYQPGYCFLCTRNKAACDLCIVKPERCHHHLGTCREPEWGLAHCFQEHVVYLANTTGLKVGISRGQNIPKRWWDQGAIQATVLLRCPSRLMAGQIEVMLAEHLQDKTDWRALISQEADRIDLASEHAIWQSYLRKHLTDAQQAKLQYCDYQLQEIRYPVLQLAQKKKALKLSSESSYRGQLLAMKGSYLIFEEVVINVRKWAGHELTVSVEA